MPADNLFPGLVLPGETPESLLAASEEYFTGAQMVPSSGAHKNIVEEVSMAQQVKKERHLSAEWVQRASEELNEKPEKVHDDINTLRSMIVAETNLHVPADDAFLLRFLRARKFNCTKAFHMLQRYYVMKLRCPELFKIPRPSEKKYILEMQAQNMLEDRDGFGRRVYIFRVEKCDAVNVSIEDVFRTNVLALEQVVDEPETQIAGLTVIVDMNGFGIQHAKFLSPYYARRTVEVIQETFPLRFKGFHVINEPFYFDAVFAVLKPFLKEKIRKRIYFHGRELSSLHAFISPDILPEEYGGKRPCFDNKSWRMALLANEDKLIGEWETISRKTTVGRPNRDSPPNLPVISRPASYGTQIGPDKYRRKKEGVTTLPVVTSSWGIRRYYFYTGGKARSLASGHISSFLDPPPSRSCDVTTAMADDTSKDTASLEPGAPLATIDGGDPTTCAPLRFLRRSFRDPALERLYQSYSVKQKRAGLQCFLYAAILYDAYMLVLPGGQDAIMRGLTAVFLALNLAALAWCCRGVQKSPFWSAIPHLAWQLATVQLLVHLFLKKNEVTARDSIGWAVLLDYILFVTLPLRLRYCVMLSAGTCASYLVAVAGLGKMDSHLVQQVCLSIVSLKLATEEGVGLAMWARAVKALAGMSTMLPMILGRVENHLEKTSPVHPTEIRTSISPSSAVALNTISALILHKVEEEWHALLNVVMGNHSEIPPCTRALPSLAPSPLPTNGRGEGVMTIAANCLLLLTANLLGLTSYYLADKQQRRAFLETRQSLEMKLVIEEQSAEQLANALVVLSSTAEYGEIEVRISVGFDPKATRYSQQSKADALDHVTTGLEFSLYIEKLQRIHGWKGGI
uniref:(California timema) hypothetical protein n=1 Tax=Timema californicum TaxID=61474 RepID=A0A7R9P502_TIMCA|nr:unnamed protein product [Timema californicum]